MPTRISNRVAATSVVGSGRGRSRDSPSSSHSPASPHTHTQSQLVARTFWPIHLHGLDGFSFLQLQQPNCHAPILTSFQRDMRKRAPTDAADAAFSSLSSRAISSTSASASASADAGSGSGCGSGSGAVENCPSGYLVGWNISSVICCVATVIPDDRAQARIPQYHATCLCQSISRV